VVDAMRQEDVADVVQVDRESAALPWPASAYRRELSSNSHARYIVVRELDGPGEEEPADAPPSRSWLQVLPWRRGEERSKAPSRSLVIGYGGMWLVGDEAHITILAVRTAYRGRGFGELILATLMETAMEMGSHWVTLEVRASNHTAQQLYRKYAFHDAGRRRRYYSDNNEDALIMTTDDMTQARFLARFGELREKLTQRLAANEAALDHAPAVVGASPGE